MSPPRQWALVLLVWVALLGLDRLGRQPPDLFLERCLAGHAQDAMRRALALCRTHDVRLSTGQARLVLDRLLELPGLALPEEDRVWFNDRLGALLARSGTATVEVLLADPGRLASWAVPVAVTDEPRPWDPLDLITMATADPVPRLVEVLGSATGPARLAALAMAGRLGTRAAPAIPLLEAALADPSPDIVALASDSLALVRAPLTEPPAPWHRPREPATVR